MPIYGDMFMRLQYEVATVVFTKKNGEIRVMLCTRNLKTAELIHGNLGGLLNGHDKRCNIHNGNISVIDMLKGEPRSFNIDRVLNVNFYGCIDTMEDYTKAYKCNKLYEKYLEDCKNEYKESLNGDLENHLADNDKLIQSISFEEVAKTIMEDL